MQSTALDIEDEIIVSTVNDNAKTFIDRLCCARAQATGVSRYWQMLHFVFDCPAYCANRDRFTAIFGGPDPSLSSFCTSHDLKVIAKFMH